MVAVAVAVAAASADATEVGSKRVVLLGGCTVVVRALLVAEIVTFFVGGRLLGD